jgi:hypothetical protein
MSVDGRCGYAAVGWSARRMAHYVEWTDDVQYFSLARCLFLHASKLV